MRLECGLLSHCYDQLTKVKCHAHVENKKKKTCRLTKQVWETMSEADIFWWSDGSDLLVSAVGLSCLQSSGAIQRVGGLITTSLQNLMLAVNLLEVVWQLGGNDTMWKLRKKRDISEQDDYASLKCQCGRHIINPCVCSDINNSATRCDVMCVTDPMLITGELQQERCTHNHSHTHLSIQTHTQNCAPGEVRLKPSPAAPQTITSL